MSITTKSLCRDTKNFFRNQFLIFLLVALLCALISIALDHIFLPRKDQIDFLNKENYSFNNIKLFEFMKNITLEQQKVLLRISTISIFSNLIKNTLLVGGVLLLIQSISLKHHIHFLSIINDSSFLLPKLFILIFFITFLIQIGIIFLIIPGVLLTIIFSFSPIMVVQDKIGIFASIYKSAKLAWQNIPLIFPAVISWLLSKTLMLLLAPSFIEILPSNVGTILFNTISNLFSTLLLIYLFRLYMLIRQ